MHRPSITWNSPSRLTCHGLLVSQRRAGLAPLELVLALPLLLMVMALTINAGTAACWKVRSAMVARDAIWSSRWPRTGLATMPQPANWPVGNANSGIQGPGAPVQALQSLAPILAQINQPVARGPVIGASNVVTTLLDPTRGMMQGTSFIQQPMPLLPLFPPITYNLVHPLLTDGWQGGTGAMQTPANPANNSGIWGWLPSNILYQYAQAPQGIIQNYQNAVLAIWFSPSLQQIQQTFNMLGAGYPGLGAGNHGNCLPGVCYCDLNPNSVLKNDIPPLAQAIQGLPGRLNQLMAQWLQNQQAQNQQPGP